MTDLFVKTEQEYTDYCERFDGDLIVTLNTQHHNPTYESISAMISKLFYQLECEEFGYKKRERYKKVCRIERIVAIEEASKVHAHIIVKQYGCNSHEEILNSIILIWHELNETKVIASNSYLVSLEDYVIRSNSAVSGYITKDIAKQLKQGRNVIDFKSGFIRKHSNKQ
jgi:hypothetical protein